MSDLSATNCGGPCNDGCGFGNEGGNNIFLILILLFCCGGNNGIGNGNDGCGSILWIIILLSCCGGGGGLF